MWENLDTRFSESCIFCHSLDSSHSEEPAASVVDSMEESSDECWDSNSDVSVSGTDSVCVPTPERPVICFTRGVRCLQHVCSPPVVLAAMFMLVKRQFMCAACLSGTED